MAMKLARCPRSKQPLVSVLLPSHDLQPVVDLLQQRQIGDYQIIINQGACLRQFQCALQLKLKRLHDLERLLLPAKEEEEEEDLEILLSSD